MLLVRSILVSITMLYILVSITALPIPLSYSKEIVAGFSLEGIVAYSGSAINGVVKNVDGTPIYNALVEFSNNTFTKKVYTYLNGSFKIELDGVSPGNYTLTIHKFGYNDIVVNVTVYASRDRIAVVGDYMGDIESIFESLGYQVDSYDSLDQLLDKIRFYKAVILNNFNSDPGIDSIVYLMDRACKWNTTLVFLDGWDYPSQINYWHSLYTLYYHSSDIEASGYPAPDYRENNYPNGEYVTIHVLKPGHPVFKNIVYDADPSNHEFYLGEYLSSWMDYAVDDFTDDNVSVLANVKDSCNNIEKPGLVEWISPKGAPWYYFSAGASYEWVMYNSNGYDNKYTWTTRQLLSNLVLYSTGFLESSEIRGVVVNESSNKPVKGAIVEIVELGLSTTTNSRGEFCFRNLTPGYYTVRVVADGFYTYQEKVSLKINARVSIDVKLRPIGTTVWLVLVYLDGDNNLEMEAIVDFNEMELIGSTNGVEIVVLLDRIPGYDDSNGDWTGTRLYHILYDPDEYTINSEQLMLWDGVWEEELNMGDPEVLLNFIQYSYNLYGGEHIALILWDHGSGFIGASRDFNINNIAYDDTDGDSLDEAEIKSVLEQLSSNGIHVDLLAMDACLMGMTEVAYEFYGYIDVFVASEEIVPGDGFEYNYWLDDLVSNPDMTASELGEVLVEAYQERYGDYYDVCLSAIDVNILGGGLAEAINLFSSYARDNMEDLVDDLENAKNAAGSFYYSDYKDLVDLMYKVKYYVDDPILNDYADYVIGNATSSVIAEWHTSDLVANGLSIWFPDSGSWSEYSSEYRSMRFSIDTEWDDMLEEYFNYGGLSIKPIEGRMGTSKHHGKPSVYREWYNIRYTSLSISYSMYRDFVLEPVEGGWIELSVEGYEGQVYIDFHGVNDQTALSCIEVPMGGGVKIYVPIGNYTIRVWVMGSKPRLYNIYVANGTWYDLVYVRDSLKVALIGGDSSLYEYLVSHRLDCDLYDNYTLISNFSEYSVVVVNKWSKSTPSAGDVVDFIKNVLGNGSSLVLLDTYDENIVAGSYVAIHYRETLLSNNIPVPSTRYMARSNKLVYYIVSCRHPVNDPYSCGQRLLLMPSGVIHSLVYYSVDNGEYQPLVVGSIYENGVTRGSGIVMYKVGNTVLAYVSFGASGLNSGETYSRKAYGNLLKQLVLNTIEASASSSTIETPQPIPENHNLVIVSIVVVLAAVIALSLRLRKIRYK